MKSLPTLFLVIVTPALGNAQSPTEAVRFFETRIRPILAEHCYSCHGAEKQKSNLRLDSAEALQRGGDSGEAILVPGKPDASRLVRMVRHEGDLKMPPKVKLTDRQIADLTQWVRNGAVYPAARQTTKSGELHWAFRPVTDPSVPGGAADGNAIDAFIRAKLAEKGLKPAPSAAPRTLIRRVTFDLTGLPPTPAEVEGFVRESAANPQAAYEALVNRLLASPAYGEKWGRHWLDVARYADSNGLDENIAHGNAWRYRDYVVKAFNDDKPYDQFVREQIAGDLINAECGMRNAEFKGDRNSELRIPHSEFDRRIATGFLSLGPKVLAEPDELKMEMDIVDEQIDTLGRTILGLTLGCARCHDHKFDPLPTEDYYALAGIFRSTKTMEHFKKIARWHENPLATPEQLKEKSKLDAEVMRLKEAIKAATAKKEKPDDLKKLKDELAALEKSMPELPSAMGVTEGKVIDTPVLRRGNHTTPGNVVARRFPEVLAGPKQSALPANTSGRLEFAKWLTRPEHPLTARVMVNRIWRWHFGQGLVRSVDNFGLLGEKPSHPELLDYLTKRFIENGWSIKQMHRLILSSATYQQSSIPHSALRIPHSEDPDNRLLWRMNVRRLEAEEIRDALLFVGGTLDRTVGGPAIKHVKNREFLFDHTSKDGTTYDSKRRSLYLPFIRNNLYDVFQLFDAPDPAVVTGDRSTTTVATQALFWMNSPLVLSAAEGMTATPTPNPEIHDVRKRLRSYYLIAYGREPTESEYERMVTALAQFSAALRDVEPDPNKRAARAWKLVGQAILAGNEFVYVN